jgi:hypothetical protein
MKKILSTTVLFVVVGMGVNGCVPITGIYVSQPKKLKNFSPQKPHLSHFRAFTMKFGYKNIQFRLNNPTNKARIVKWRCDYYHQGLFGITAKWHDKSSTPHGTLQMPPNTYRRIGFTEAVLVHTKTNVTTECQTVWLPTKVSIF